MNQSTDFCSSTITISIPSNPRYLKLVRSIVLHSAMLDNFSEKICKDITLAVDEAITNVIKHSYKNKTNKEIIIKISFERDHLKLIIRDFGKKVDPKTIKPRELEDIKPGGLGVFFIKKIMDDVEYDISSIEGTTLIMKKYFE